MNDHRTPPPDASPRLPAGDDAEALARPSRVPWPPILLVVTVAAGWALQRHLPLTWNAIDGPAVPVVGWALLLGGLALAGWAILTMVGSGAQVRPDRAATTLVSRGPFRWSRNPIYAADALLLLGLAGVTGNIWLGLLTPLFVVAVTWLAILPEERHLEWRFGEPYRAYKAGTRRWL